MYYNASQGRGPRDANIVLLLAAHAGGVRLCQLTSDKNLQADKTSDKWFVASSSDIYFSFALFRSFYLRPQHCRLQAVAVQIPGVRPPAEHAPPGNMHDGERLLREVKIGKQSLSLSLSLSF